MRLACSGATDTRAGHAVSWPRHYQDCIGICKQGAPADDLAGHVRLKLRRRIVMD
jgi:hypothetical protein